MQTVYVVQDVVHDAVHIDKNGRETLCGLLEKECDSWLPMNLQDPRDLTCPKCIASLE